jgi:two-component system nitrogen regulation response regulator NtrX
MSTCQTGRLLIFDDEGEWTEGILETLAEQGYETRIAASSQQALQYLTEQDVDLLLIPSTISESDGLSVIAKAQEIDPQLVIVLISD